MKAFKFCDRRTKDNKCIQGDRECSPETVDIDPSDSFLDNGCWRMCHEHVYYMMCPDCSSDLYFDNHGDEKNEPNTLGLYDNFHCPKCNKQVDRKDSLVTIERLNKELKKHEKWIKNYKEWEKKNPCVILSPREYDSVNGHKADIRRLNVMILRLAKGEKIHMERNLTGYKNDD